MVYQKMEYWRMICWKCYIGKWWVENDMSKKLCVENDMSKKLCVENDMS